MVGKYLTHHKYSVWTPNNVDAAFVTATGLPQPSALLLHYRYAANVLIRWGRNTEKLSELEGSITRRPKPCVGSSTKQTSETSDDRLSANPPHFPEPSQRFTQAGGASTEAKDSMDLLLEIPHLRQNILDARAARQEELRIDVLDWQSKTTDPQK